MAEPMVLSAGVTFCLISPNLDIANVLVEKLNDQTTTDPQHRGKLLEFLIAARLHELPGRLMDLPDWPEGMKLPRHAPLGVLVGVLLTDPRLKFAALDQCPARGEVYWLSLPENEAGPDLVAPRMLFSMKTTSSNDKVSSEESKKSIKTTTPSKFYTDLYGVALKGAAWTRKYKETQEAVKKWKGPIVRVRVELPACSRDTTPRKAMAFDGSWSCKEGDVYDQNIIDRPSDIMVYLDADRCKEALQIDWKSSLKK